MNMSIFLAISDSSIWNCGGEVQLCCSYQNQFTPLANS